MRELDVRALFAVYGGSEGRFGLVMTAFTILGGGWATLPLLPLVLWTKTRRPVRSLLFALAIQATLVWWLKLMVGRVRPWLAFGLPAPLGSPHDGSFPSGHAAGSFCVAAFLVTILPGLLPRSASVSFSLVAVVAAVLVGVSRVYLGAHFPADVIAGAFMGTFVGVRAASRSPNTDARAATSSNWNAEVAGE